MQVSFSTGNNNNSGGASAGSVFVSLLSVAFIVLKLLGIIDWPWLWVLSPIWISAGLVFVIMLVFIVIYHFL